MNQRKGVQDVYSLLVILVLLVVGALRTWPYSSGWGYGPSGGIGVVLLILLILVLTGRLYGAPCVRSGQGTANGKGKV
jgi:hypothetical protein